MKIGARKVICHHPNPPCGEKVNMPIVDSEQSRVVSLNPTEMLHSQCPSRMRPRYDLPRFVCTTILPYTCRELEIPTPERTGVIIF